MLTWMGKRGRPPHPDILTPREWEVLALLRLELSNLEIAEKLGISRDGAKYHVSQILGKLGLENREQVARWQYEDARPWWATAFAPLLPAWRRGAALASGASGTAARAALFITVVAAVGGLGLLALLLFSQDGDGEEGVIKAPSQLLYWDADGALWLVDANGTRQTFANGVECESSSPHWSPTGETPVCGRGDGSVVFLDGEGEVLGELAMEDMWLMYWSPTGEHVLFATLQGTEEEPEYELHIADRTGELVADLGPWEFGSRIPGQAYRGFPLWSPDGSRVAYRTADTGETVIYSLETDESETLEGDYYPLGWALGGDALLVAANYEERRDELNTLRPPAYEVSVLDLASGDLVTRIPELDSGRQFWLSPDGETVALLTQGPPGAHGPGLQFADLRSGALTNIPEAIISNPTESINPSQVKFSQNGDQLYWVDSGAPALVHMANVDGTGLTKLAEVPTLGASLSPDLTQLAYHISDDDVDSVTLYIRDISERRDQQIDVQSFAGQNSKSPFRFAWRPVPR